MGDPDLSVRPGNFVELFFNATQVLFERFQVSEFQIQFATPQFVRVALNKWLYVLDQQSPPTVPRLCSLADGDALIGEDGSNRAFTTVDTIDDLLAILNEPPALSNWLAGNVRWNEFTEGSKTSKFDRIVFVCFTFDVLEQPGVFVSTTDNDRNLHLTAEIADPTTGTTSFGDNKLR